MKRIALILAMTSCISLAAFPMIAADYTLGIFGNANMDDVIDEDDMEYVRKVIDGSNEATELADANYDGHIDEEDISQIELIIGVIGGLNLVNYGGIKLFTSVCYLSFPPIVISILAIQRALRHQSLPLSVFQPEAIASNVDRGAMMQNPV